MVWVYCLERDGGPGTIPLPLDTFECGGRLQDKPHLYELPIVEMRDGPPITGTAEELINAAWFARVVVVEFSLGFGQTG